MSFTLDTVPGFADLPDASLVANAPALALYLNRINNNAAFGMERMEIFITNHVGGDTVPLPVSSIDGYQYARNELTYLWGIASTFNPSTNWETGPETLWYGAWEVVQATGAVSIAEAYRTRHKNDGAISQDGTLQVFTIAQRQLTSLRIAAPATSYTDQADSGFVTDAALTQGMIQGMNDNAKFGVIRGECIYLGEFYSGQTVPRATSPADGYQYTYAEMTLQACWRWTTLGNSTATQAPDLTTGQLGPIIWSINASTGVVSITVNYIGDGTEDAAPVSGYGRLAVFAFCSRTNLMGAVPGTANAFAEIEDSVFVPGATLRASTMLQLNKNIRESACTPEFFGATEYAAGDTIPVPTSPIDSYVYSRDELSYIWGWSDTTPSSGTHTRTVGFTGNVNQAGAVALDVWRFAQGGPIVPGLESGQHLRIRVTVIGCRKHVYNVTVGPSANTPGDVSSITGDQSAIEPYAIPMDIGDGVVPTANQSLLKHVISGDVASVIFASGLPTSGYKARTASTGTYVITVKLNGTTMGTITFSAGNPVAALSFSGFTGAPADELEWIGQATPDATLAGIYGTLSGTRT